MAHALSGDRTVIRRRAVIDQRDLQGNVLAGYGNDFDEALYAFVRVNDPAAGRALVGDLAGRVTNAIPWTSKPTDTLNVALTYDGLRALGVAERYLDTFPEEFRQGMAARAELLGDTAASAPQEWEPGLREGEVHLLITIFAQERAAISRRHAELREQVAAWGSGLTMAPEQRAALLRDSERDVFAREHFGFADGLAQPSIAARGLQRGSKAGPNLRAGQGTPTGRNGWKDVAPGEFVLGYPDEDRQLPDAPAEPLGRNGSFMVVRKLQQHVELFERYLREAAGGDPGLEELLAAKIVGRWRDGTPLSRCPEHPSPELLNDPHRVEWINDFRYASDPQGLRCPLGAHIRRANPRDAFGWEGSLTKRHRIIRRGMPYGDPHHDGGERGLMFVCYQASIARQFEVVQDWLNDGDAFGLADEKDFLVADEDARGRMTIPGGRPMFLSPRPSFVTLRGGGYFFTPGLAALRALAAGL